MFPILRISMKVHHRKDEDAVRFNSVDHAEWKSVQTMTSDVVRHDAEGFRCSSYP